MVRSRGAVLLGVVVLALAAASNVAYPAQALRLDRVPLAGSIQLEWGISCGGADSEYVIYEGPIGQFDAHLPAAGSGCGGSSARQAELVPASGSSYYLIVPRDTEGGEGSYGLASNGLPRWRSASACGPSAVAPCAQPTGERLSLFVSFDDAESVPVQLGEGDCSSGSQTLATLDAPGVTAPQLTDQLCAAGRCLAVDGLQALAIDSGGILDSDRGSLSFHFRWVGWENYTTLLLMTDLEYDAFGLSMQHEEELAMAWVDDGATDFSAYSDTWGSSCWLGPDRDYWVTCSYTAETGRHCRLFYERGTRWEARCHWQRSTPLSSLDVPQIVIGNPSTAGGAFLIDNVILSRDPAFPHRTLRDVTAVPPGSCSP